MLEAVLSLLGDSWLSPCSQFHKCEVLKSSLRVSGVHCRINGQDPAILLGGPRSFSSHLFAFFRKESCLESSSMVVSILGLSGRRRLGILGILICLTQSCQEFLSLEPIYSFQRTIPSLHLPLGSERGKRLATQGQTLSHETFSKSSSIQPHSLPWTSKVSGFQFLNLSWILWHQLFHVVEIVPQVPHSDQEVDRAQLLAFLAVRLGNDRILSSGRQVVMYTPFKPGPHKQLPALSRLGSQGERWTQRTAWKTLHYSRPQGPSDLFLSVFFSSIFFFSGLYISNSKMYISSTGPEEQEWGWKEPQNGSREHRKGDVNIYCLAFLLRTGRVADEKEITIFLHFDL